MQCPACQYNLDGLTAHVCPECGAPFDPRTAGLAHQAPAGPTILRVYAITLAVPIASILCAWIAAASMDATGRFGTLVRMAFRFVSKAGIAMLIPCCIIALTLGVVLACEKRNPLWALAPILVFGGALAVMRLDPFGLIWPALW
ncbi:MAG: hypothetical protein H7Y88_01845 [Phycisphaerales bacterium]|nr:hypothetical protein [Phycisphaerales bacterium]